MSDGVKGYPYSIPVKVDGVEYESIIIAAKTLSLNINTLRCLKARKGNAFEYLGHSFVFETKKIPPKKEKLKKVAKTQKTVKKAVASAGGGTMEQRVRALQAQVILLTRRLSDLTAEVRAERQDIDLIKAIEGEAI